MRRTAEWMLTAGLVLGAVAPAIGQDGPGLSVQAFEGYAAFKQGDHARAYRILRPVAEAGHRGAMIQLAYLYEHGLGVGRNQARAEYWTARSEAAD